MPIRFHILNAAGSLGKFEKDIKHVTQSSLKEAQRSLSFRNVDIVFQIAERPGSLKVLGGVAGYCPRGDYIRISIDRSSVKSRKRFRQDLKRTLLHELHHAARNQRGFPLSQCTLLEQLVTEGLADYFVFELTGNIPTWSLQKISTEKALRTFKYLLKKKVTEVLFKEFFTEGSQPKKIKRWTGYALGFSLVRDFVFRHPTVTSTMMVGKSAKTFLR